MGVAYLLLRETRGGGKDRNGSCQLKMSSEKVAQKSVEEHCRGGRDECEQHHHRSCYCRWPGSDEAKEDGQNEHRAGIGEPEQLQAIAVKRGQVRKRDSRPCAAEEGSGMTCPAQSHKQRGEHEKQ